MADGPGYWNCWPVHLSPDLETANKVGMRRGKPVILVIDSARMSDDGFAFDLSANGVWLTDHVPAGYLRRAEIADRQS